MHIIIAGGGKVGVTLVRLLSAEGHDLTLIDRDKSVLESCVEQYDVMAVDGNCASMPVLLRAGAKNADLLIASTNADEVNLLCCMTAHGINKQMHTIARIRNPDYTEQIYKMRNFFALSLTVNPEKQAAKEIERLLKYPGFLRRDTFAKGRIEIVELRVDSSSKLCNISLSEMYRTVKARVLVCTVQRGDKAIVPKGDFVLREGDRLFITAPTAELTILLKNLGIITRRVRSCLLCGGDRISYYLSELLIKDGIAVKIIEKSPERCRELAISLPKADIILGDCSSQKELEDQRISDFDAVVTLTGIDEMNMIISLYASSCHVPQVITKLGRPENYLLADSISLGSTICPRELSSNNIVRYVRAMENQSGAAISMHAIADGLAEAVEFLVDESTPHCGEPLKALQLKPNVLIASITHGSDVRIPNGDSMFLPGDTVVVISTGRGVLQHLGDIFA